MGFGTIVGSAVFNVLLVIGVCAFLSREVNDQGACVCIRDVCMEWVRRPLTATRRVHVVVYAYAGAGAVVLAVVPGLDLLLRVLGLARGLLRRHNAQSHHLVSARVSQQLNYRVMLKACCGHPTGTSR